MRGVWRLRQWLGRLAPKAIVLLYHRVAQVPTDPQLLCVTPTHFAEHLDVLRQEYHPLSLHSLRRRLTTNFWVPRSVVLTFDDGYADVLCQAKPLLEAAEVPATVFVTSGKVGEGREFWWDELERLVLLPNSLPPTLELNVAGQAHAWAVGNSGKRRALYDELHGLLRPLDDTERQQALAWLAAWAGVERVGRPEYRALTGEELCTLSEGGLVEVGAHTVTHLVLSALSLTAQRVEIAESKRQLEAILGQPVTSFSYPYGGKDDYNAETLESVRAAGFDCACSNFPGLITWETDPFQIPRHLVRDWDGDEFARRLAGWFDEG